MMENPGKAGRLPFLDLLNIFACFAVILMHTNGGAYWKFEDTDIWRSGVVVGALCNWAVPVFFMISGANLINYDERYTTRLYFKKRVAKTCIPFLLWSVVPLLIWVYRGKLGQDVSLMQMLNYIINTKVNETYWFFIPLFSAYLCIPVFTMIRKECQKKVFSWLVLYAFLSISLIPVILKVTGGPLKYNGFLSAPVMGGFLLFVLGGVPSGPLLVLICQEESRYLYVGISRRLYENLYRNILVLERWGTQSAIGRPGGFS